MKRLQEETTQPNRPINTDIQSEDCNPSEGREKVVLTRVKVSGLVQQQFHSLFRCCFFFYI